MRERERFSIIVLLCLRMTCTLSNPGKNQCNQSLKLTLNTKMTFGEDDDLSDGRVSINEVIAEIYPT